MRVGRAGGAKIHIYEIINPSDCCTFEAPTHEVATLVVFILGEGQYGGRSATCDEVPIFIFGGAAEWYAKTFGRDFAAGLDAFKPELVTSLRSLIYCDVGTRAAILAAGGDLAKFNDSKRSSLNNIGGRAVHYADRLAETAA